MNTALVSGASSGIGLEITKTLISMSYRVCGVARNFDDCDYSDTNFIKKPCDLNKQDELMALAAEIKKEEIAVLVNCAGVGYFAPHEEIKSEDIVNMVQLNLTAPLLLTKELLRSLKQNKGTIININSISGVKSAPHGAAYGATKAALRHFGNSLFDEARKSGLKVVNINPDITKTPFYDKLHFKYCDEPLSYIEPSCIANVVRECLSARPGTVISEVTLQPQKFMIDKKKPSR